jgi:hypothetical protein
MPSSRGGDNLGDLSVDASMIMNLTGLNYPRAGFYEYGDDSATLKAGDYFLQRNNYPLFKEDAVN